MKTIAWAMAAMAGGSAALGQVSFTGPAITQSFDSLASGNGVANSWANNTTLPGWHLFRRQDAANENPPVAVTTYTSGNATNPATGGNVGFYSFGDAGSGERALGGTGGTGGPFGTVADGATSGWIAVSITNNTGVPLDSVTVGFDGEQWRAPVAAQQTMVLQYAFGATFGGVASWTSPGGTFEWSGPVFGGATGVGGIGNTTGRVTGVGGTLSGLNWGAGETMWIRWIERNDTGNDASLAIDNFSFVPTPGAAAVLALGLIAPGRRRR